MKRIARSVIVFSVCAGFAADAFAAEEAIAIYPAYASGDAAAVEGRVIASEDAAPASATDSRRTNAGRNLGLMMNQEREAYRVDVRAADTDWSAITDEEGYFRIELRGLSRLSPGWHPVVGRAGEAMAESGLLLVPKDNVAGLISDLDDTILVSEVNSTRRLLGNTFLGNPLQREAVPGTAGLYRTLASRNADPAAAPTFYLSASPRQLHGSIQAFLDHNGFPRGVLITKRVTNDATSEPLRDQVAYKVAKIEEILRRLPAVRFTLIGDDGERDPEIYRQIRERYPDRVAAIWIRRVHPDPERARYPDQGNLADLLSKP